MRRKKIGAGDGFRSGNYSVMGSGYMILDLFLLTKLN